MMPKSCSLDLDPQVKVARTARFGWPLEWRESKKTKKVPTAREYKEQAGFLGEVCESPLEPTLKENIKTSNLFNPKHQTPPNPICHLQEAETAAAVAQGLP